MNAIRIGIMGFGGIGRQLYKLASSDDRFDVVAVADIGRKRTRLMPTNEPKEIPWDMFNVDVVIDATGRFRSAEELLPHVKNGAGRVITSTLPEGEIDRVVLYGVNHDQMQATDRVVSAGSGSTTATALALQVIAEQHEIEHASMTSVHAYTSDQSLQDYAGEDYRRSRSGAENIIPNTTPALKWLQKLMPQFDGKLTGYALNVPVQVGSMLDITVAFKKPLSGIDEFRALFIAAAEQHPNIIGVVDDPIVSSDVRGVSQSLLVDLQGREKIQPTGALHENCNKRLWSYWSCGVSHR